jgi:hypothetical protein
MKPLLCALTFTVGMIGLMVSNVGAAHGVTGKILTEPDRAGEPIHCRVYPHWHSKAKPHRFGRGCPKRTRPARNRRA